jgi:hypothetical protein
MEFDIFAVLNPYHGSYKNQRADNTGKSEFAILYITSSWKDELKSSEARWCGFAVLVL